MKRTIALLLFLTYLTLTFAYDAKVNNVYYNLNKEQKTASVTYKKLDQWSSYAGQVEIPEIIKVKKEKYVVTSIGDSAFFGCHDLELLNLPSTITSIGKSAFEECTYNIKVDDEINYDRPICYSLPKSLISIADRAFAFSGLIFDLRMPASLTTIGNEAFLASKIKSVYVNDSLKHVGYAAFQDCEQLMGISINSLESWCKIEFETIYSNPLSSAHNLLLNATQKLIDIEIPDGITKILPNTFVASSIQTIKIPASVQSIGSYAFFQCLDLYDVSILNPDIEIADYNFEDYEGNLLIGTTTLSERKNTLYNSLGDDIFFTTPTEP